MLNLYCYHAPLTSSAGFQESHWSVTEDTCRELSHGEMNEDVRAVLLEGGSEALCFDTEQETRVFAMRNIQVRSDSRRGWHLNFALETDAESYAAWADLTAAFLHDYGTITAQFAELFSVRYNGGEHYEMDVAGFLELMRSAVGAAGMMQDTLPRNSGKIRTFVRQLNKPFKPVSGRLWLLVPTTTEEYFMGRTSLTHLSKPRLRVEREEWFALLAHEEVKEDAEEEETGEAGKRLPYLIGATAVAAAVIGICMGAARHRKQRGMESSSSKSRLAVPRFRRR